MTDQERQLLEELAGRVQRAPAAQVDRDADELIRNRIGTRPDALYILTQTVLLQEMALNRAKQQIDELKSRQPQGSFLGNTPPPAGTGWGGNQERTPAAPSGYRASSYQSGYVPPPAAARQEPPPLPPDSWQEAPRSRFSGFLQNAAQTAAGVVAGEVAFSAISSLFGHHGGGYSGGSGFLGGGGGFVSPGSETIINNYYEEGRGDHGDRFVSDASDLGPGDDRRGDDSRDNGGYLDPNDDGTEDASDDTPDDSGDDSSYDDGSDSVDV